MANESHRVQVLVAVIGTVGVIAAAIITSRGRPDPAPTPAPTATPDPTPTPAPTDTPDPSHFEIKFSVNLQGGDYDNLDMTTDKPAECARVCDRDDRCKAFTFTPRGHEGPRARCWLKSTVPVETHVPGFVSGVKLK